jgi:formylmethanofuran dehydrogenase subunit C
MAQLKLRPIEPTAIPVEAEVISPDVLAGKTLEEASALKVYYGNEVHPLSDFFKLDGETAEKPEEQTILVEGNAKHVKYIGKQMSRGRIIIQGDSGMHTGSQMQGGEIIVNGDAGEWTGAELKGGRIKVLGDVGNLLGAAYRGSAEGMTGGQILVMGNAGSEACSFMRRGMIVVKGDTGDFTGVHMNGGEVFILGKTGRRAGAQAKGNGGFIACFGGVDEILPTYRYDTTYTPVFMRLYLRELVEKHDLKELVQLIDAPLKRYRGDLAVGGNSELLIAEKD